MSFRIVIITRDSARWIGIVAQEYSRLGLRPLYLVHDKTVDATASILRERGEDFASISLPENRAESGLSQLSAMVKEEWVLRMDDDEFPSRRMIAFTKRTLDQTREQAIAYARREVLPGSFPLTYPTIEILYSAPLTPFHLDLQMRAFRHKEVVYKDEIHTPGFLPESLRVAPSDAYIAHFNTTIRPLPARLLKLARYEKEKPGAGTLPVARTSVPELAPLDDFRPRRFETDEFNALARQLGAIEHPIETEKPDPEIERLIREAFTQRTPMSMNGEKLVKIRQLLEALPKPLRSYFGLI